MASNKNFQLAFEIGGKVAASLPKSFNVAHPGAPSYRLVGLHTHQ